MHLWLPLGILWWGVAALEHGSVALGSEETDWVENFWNERQIRVVSYNLQNLEGDWESRLYQIAQLILKQKPDFVGLQELRVNRATGVSQVEYMQKQLGSQYHLHYFKAMQYRHHLEEGIAVAVQSNIHSSSINVRLPRITGSRDPNHRASIITELRMQDGLHICFVNLHASYDQSARKHQILNLLTQIDAKCRDNPAAVVMVADFNFFHEYNRDVKHIIDAGFKDAWKDAHLAQVSRGHGFTFSTNNPHNRPDRLYFKRIAPAFEVYASRFYCIGTSKMMLTGKDGVARKTYLSDHQGIVGVISIKPIL